MRLLQQHFVGLLLYASAVAQGVALVNFDTSLSTESLSAECSTDFHQEIHGCSASDFLHGAGCSSSCISGVVDIVQQVTEACASDDVPETSIIGIILQGKGVEVLCPNVVVTTASSTSKPTGTGMVTSGTLELPSTTPASDSSTSLLIDTSSSPVVSSTSREQDTTSAAASSTLSSASVTATTLSTSAQQPSAAASSTPALITSITTGSTTSSTTASSTKTHSPDGNDESGGGSPFDIQALESNDASTSNLRSTLLSIPVALIATYLLF